MECDTDRRICKIESQISWVKTTTDLIYGTMLRVWVVQVVFYGILFLGLCKLMKG